jgi:hypothetical protein
MSQVMGNTKDKGGPLRATSLDSPLAGRNTSFERNAPGEAPLRLSTDRATAVTKKKCTPGNFVTASGEQR